MINISDLTGISEAKRRQAIECLDTLMTLSDPVISGYNWYGTLPLCDTIVTLSHMHQTERYKEDMLNDLKKLGYNPKAILLYIREKAATFWHELEFRLTNDEGNVYEGRKVKNVKTQRYLTNREMMELERYPEKFKDIARYLIDEDLIGWELDMPFNSQEELLRLVDMFLKKSGTDVYNENGGLVEETEEEKKARAPWTDAYETPVLLLGELALRHIDKLPQFVLATKLALKENTNEISFVIHSKIERLRDLPHYERLLQLGFSEELCLANKPFILDYVNKNR